MAAETSPEDSTAASSSAVEGTASASAPDASQTEEAAALTSSKKSSTSEMNLNDAETKTDATAESVNEEKPETADAKAIVSASKRSRPAYKFDPDKITLRFLFANRDGLTVTLECEPSDTVAEVKAALMSVWPDGKYRQCYIVYHASEERYCNRLILKIVCTRHSHFNIALRL
jgi:activator of HSP90 ATPase